MRMIEFLVEGKAVGKGRPRFTCQGHAYTPQKTREFETRVSIACKHAAWHSGPLNGQIRAVIDASFAPPISWSKKKRNEAIEGKIAPGRPDIDNVVKAVLDACNGIAFEDDAQVVEIHARKFYDCLDFVRVIFTEMEEENG